MASSAPWISFRVVAQQPETYLETGTEKGDRAILPEANLRSGSKNRGPITGVRRRNLVGGRWHMGEGRTRIFSPESREDRGGGRKGRFRGLGAGGKCRIVNGGFRIQKSFETSRSIRASCRGSTKPANLRPFDDPGSRGLDD
jgi:hypothetical protein